MPPHELEIIQWNGTIRRSTFQQWFVRIAFSIALSVSMLLNIAINIVVSLIGCIWYRGPHSGDWDVARFLQEHGGPFAFRHRYHRATTFRSRSLRQISRLTKYVQDESMATLRQPFLATLCQPSKELATQVREIHTRLFYENGNVDIFEIIPANEELIDQRADTIFYVHGGGFVSGDFAGYKGFCYELVRRLRCRLFFPQYRLCPEVSMKDSVRDIQEVYDWLVNGRGICTISCMADSAGANLLLLMLQQQSQSLTRPQRILLQSPLLDPSCSGASHHLCANTDTVFVPAVVRYAMNVAMRFGIEENQDPSVCSLRGPVGPLLGIPLLIMVATDEVFLSDSIAIANRLHRRGSPVEVIFGIGLFHTWPLFWNHLTESREGVDEIVRFIQRPL